MLKTVGKIVVACFLLCAIVLSVNHYFIQPKENASEEKQHKEKPVSEEAKDTTKSDVKTESKSVEQIEAEDELMYQEYQMKQGVENQEALNAALSEYDRTH
ncbi:hypothetical protein [Priestia filamentosa]|uniref:hypothetical protein n=1 Tax=Priestia filamentosa TaxID=1402861 RepID=UPI000A085EF7|nr:hypothetical protein [Priestia filamentosa]MDT3762957.1 hypothetical protein [Priestia filamentosa]OXS69479.1 hypothetical protein B1B01_10955 [Priestia filamentosa]WRU97398.1 hypothetical protein RYX51_10110 [Priestia filamentosa]SMF33088.1 hypothetical protein SAMN06296056_102763 [Priestia filamentosa]